MIQVKPHYEVLKVDEAMPTLKGIFPNGKAGDNEFCLFSTSGVHGTYQTIEEEEREPGTGITFLIVFPRLVVLQYGIVYPQTPEDFEFLKTLRASSWSAVQKIGSHTMRTFEDITRTAREELKRGLYRCSDRERLVFKKMYANGKLEMPIEEVVDQMDQDKLDWAMQQVKRTLDKKNELDN